MSDDEACDLIEQVMPLLRANPGKVLTPAAFATAGLTADQAKDVCAALTMRPDLARVDLGVFLDGVLTDAVIEMDFSASPSIVAPDIATWHSPRLAFLWRVTPIERPPDTA